MDEAKKQQELYESALKQLAECSYGVKPNYQQADPFNVPVPGAPAGYTLRDLIGKPTV